MLALELRRNPQRITPLTSSSTHTHHWVRKIHIYLYWIIQSFSFFILTLYVLKCTPKYPSTYACSYLCMWPWRYKLRVSFFRSYIHINGISLPSLRFRISNTTRLNWIFPYFISLKVERFKSKMFSRSLKTFHFLLFIYLFTQAQALSRSLIHSMLVWWLRQSLLTTLNIRIIFLIPASLHNTRTKSIISQQSITYSAVSEVRVGVGVGVEGAEKNRNGEKNCFLILTIQYKSPLIHLW